MNDLTLIIPAKNESESLPQVIDDLKSLDCQIKVSLKNNDITTIKSIENKNVEIFYQPGIGYGNSLKEAINDCKTKYFCIFNADGSFDQKDLFQMYQLMKKNDFVYTSRYENEGGSEDDTIITFIGNKFFSKLGEFLFSLKINDILYTYLMGNTSSFKSLNIQSNDFRFCVELPIKMQLLSMKYTSIPSYEKKRIAGKKKVNAFIDGFLILTEMIKLFLIFKIFRNKTIN
jgi:glycosyltransferase involved in cell wall biosynthesis